MTSPFGVRSLVVLAVTSALVACTIGETRYETVTLPAQVISQTITCNSPVVEVDLSTLKACGDGGKGHCYDVHKVPVPTDQVAPCDDPTQSCIPDKILTANGGKLKSCQFYGNPGACISTLFKQVKENLAALPQDACDPDERCAPCTDPRNNQSTGLCNDGVGAHEQACVGGPGSGTTACCHGMGVCTNQNAVPPQQRDHLDAETCKGDGMICAPAALVNGKPVKCDVLGFGGVCLDYICFAPMFQATTQLTRSSCGPTEMCMPCLLGKSQGMPGCD
jgi:hypothetical protein